MSNLISVAFSLFGDLFVLTRLLHVIESNQLTLLINYLIYQRGQYIFDLSFK